MDSQIDTVIKQRMNNKNNLSLKGWKRVKCKVDVVREAKNGVKKEPEFYFCKFIFIEGLMGGTKASH